jgi:hypothetical protein
MSYEIVSSVVFALILFRLIEDGVEYVADKLLKRKRDKDFKKLLANLEDSLPFSKPFTPLANCIVEDCDICGDDEGTISIPVIEKKPVKRAATKTKAVRRPVKKAVAKKKAAPKRK